MYLTLHCNKQSSGKKTSYQIEQYNKIVSSQGAYQIDNIKKTSYKIEEYNKIVSSQAAYQIDDIQYLNDAAKNGKWEWVYVLYTKYFKKPSLAGLK